MIPLSLRLRYPIPIALIVGICLFLSGSLLCSPSWAGQVEWLACMGSRCPSGSDFSCRFLCESALQSSASEGGAPPQYRGRQHGAFAIDRETLRFGYAYNHSTEKDAESAALKGCAKGSGKDVRCVVEMTFYNNCGALVASREKAPLQNVIVGKWADRKNQAVDSAMRECKAKGGSNCVLEIALCSS